jgi:hypothetical protein
LSPESSSDPVASASSQAALTSFSVSSSGISFISNTVIRVISQSS